MAESEEELKSLLLKVKEESENDLILKTQKTKITASSPITSWQIDGETIETVIDFISLGSKIIADGDCNYELKDVWSLEEKLDQPRQHIKKQWHYIANKGPSSQSFGFFSNHIWM